MLDFPSVLSTGRVHGRFIIAVIDGPDPGDEPDVIPAKGRIVFKASIEYTTVGEGADAVTMILAPVAGVLDDEGYLCTPHPETGEPMYRGVVLTATDDPDMSVTGWTWSADYRFEPSGTVTYKIPAHSFELPSMADRDLSTLVKVPSSPGYGLPQAEGAALRAEAAAVKSSDSAAQAFLIAQSVRDDADAGLFKGEPGKDGAPGNATLRVDTSVGKRVFISDGTTEHMISGDTGWRDIRDRFTGLNDAKYTASTLKIRRVDDDVWLEVAVLSSDNVIPNGTALKLYSNLPSDLRGFTFSGNYNFPAGKTGSIDLVIGTLATNAFMWGYALGGNVGAGGFRVSTSFKTSDPWPTTLPGTPA